jgi:hypothetical protein
MFLTYFNRINSSKPIRELATSFDLSQSRMQFAYNKAVEADTILFCFVKVFLSIPLERVTCRLRRLTLEYGRLIEF